MCYVMNLQKNVNHWDHIGLDYYKNISNCNATVKVIGCPATVAVSSDVSSSEAVCGPETTQGLILILNHC